MEECWSSKSEAKIPTRAVSFGERTSKEGPGMAP